MFGASGIWILKKGERVDVRNRFQKTLCKKALIGDDIVNTLKNNEKKGKTWKREQKLKRKKIDGLEKSKDQSKQMKCIKFYLNF